MAEGRDLVKEALQDAKSLREAAVESAKNQLVESLAPAVRELLNKELRNTLSEKRGIRTLNGKVASGEQRADHLSDKDAKFEEGVDPKQTLEGALQEFFPKDDEKEEKPKMTEEKKSSKNEAADKKSSKKSEVNEEIEISEAELKRVYEAALQTEVQVKKGFSDIEGGGELADAQKHTGIEDRKNDQNWEDVLPPAHKDYSVKEAIRRGVAENRALRENLRKAVAMIETLGKKLHEVNLFNAKVLHVNKILNAGVKLNREQKTFVMETVDKARSISEVKVVYEALMGSFKSASAALTESRNVRPPRADAQRVRSSGTPKQEVLSESVDNSTRSDIFSRTRELAGLVNGKK